MYTGRSSNLSLSNFQRVSFVIGSRKFLRCLSIFAVNYRKGWVYSRVNFYSPGKWEVEGHWVRGIKYNRKPPSSRIARIATTLPFLLRSLLTCPCCIRRSYCLKGDKKKKVVLELSVAFASEGRKAWKSKRLS
jgi:hypothetical protein